MKLTIFLLSLLYVSVYSNHWPYPPAGPGPIRPCTPAPWDQDPIIRGPRRPTFNPIRCRRSASTYDWNLSGINNKIEPLPFDFKFSGRDSQNRPVPGFEIYQPIVRDEKKSIDWFSGVRVDKLSPLDIAPVNDENDNAADISRLSGQYEPNRNDPMKKDPPLV